MRLAVMSDIHANPPAPGAALADIATGGPDAVLAGGPPVLDPDAVGRPALAGVPGTGQPELRSRPAALARRSARWGPEPSAPAHGWSRAGARANERGFPKWAGALAGGAVLS